MPASCVAPVSHRTPRRGRYRYVLPVELRVVGELGEQGEDDEADAVGTMSEQRASYQLQRAQDTSGARPTWTQAHISAGSRATATRRTSQAAQASK